MENLVMTEFNNALIAFWQNKKVFITGHTGFKGAWLTIWLESLGANICGYALAPPTQPNLFELCHAEKNITHIVADINDFKKLASAINSFRPDIIFHMAAQPLVRYSYYEPIETYTTNVLGTVHILEAARHCEAVKAIVNVTSDKCYQNNEWLWGYKEVDRLGGHDPYSNSKACAELVTLAYRNSYFTSNATMQKNLASARSGNVIGGGDWAKDRLIPDMIQAFSKNEIVAIRNPKATRPWQHVLEPLSGYLLLAQKLYESNEFSEAWNFGPDNNDIKPVAWIADYVHRAWGKNADWHPATKSGPHEADLLHLDCTKSKMQLGWHPKWRLEEGLTKTIEWYKAHQERQNMRQFTLQQINTFMTS